MTDDNDDTIEVKHTVSTICIINYFSSQEILEDFCTFSIS